MYIKDMNTGDITIINLVTTMGVAVSVIGGFIYTGKKLQILDDLKITSDKVKRNLTVISNFLIRYAQNFNATELQALSPLTLTPDGQKFIEEIGFNNVFGAHQADFFQCLESEKPKLKYDVESAAIKSISMLYDKEYMDFLKVFFYNNPKRTIENTAPTLGIYMRDKYLSEHPEITQ